MVSEASKAVSEEARRIYDSRLRPALESTHAGKYVCIEPSSGRFFLGNTFDEAVNAALDECPNQLTHTLRIGHLATLHLGALNR